MFSEMILYFQDILKNIKNPDNNSKNKLLSINGLIHPRIFFSMEKVDLSWTLFHAQ